MEYRNIEGLDFAIPLVTFGGAALSGEGGGYGFGQMSWSEAEILVKASIDHGINVFDTAPIYGFGMSEERLGKFLPKEAILISKSGVDWHQNMRVNMSNSALVTERMLHESLKRLQRDCIDIYMIHWPDQKVDIRVPLEVLLKAKEAGKIKYIGLCNTNLNDLTKAEEITPITVIQSELNLFNQKAFIDLNDEWKKRISLGWGTFDKGILSGRVTHNRSFPSEDARSWAPWWNKKEVTIKIDKVEILKQILVEYGISLADFSLHFSVKYFGVTSSLIGFKTVGDIVHVASALQQHIMRERIEIIMQRWAESIRCKK